MSKLENLQPQNVFHYFEEICQIPHGSYNVDQISDYLADFAKKHKLEYYQDELKNVVIIKEATDGYETEPAVIIQGHMDMVAVKKPDCNIDMKKEGLDIDTDGEYVYANGTSLGGDDGIAVAIALAILASDDIKHPRLECVFTVNEETGMEGAFGIDLSMLKGRQMLNLDSEEEDTLLVSCAGGARVSGMLKVNPVEKQGIPVHLTVDGLQGGHSGTEIHKGRVNAILLMARILKAMEGKGISYCLCAYDGGLAENAIPRKCDATILIQSEDEAKFVSFIAEYEKLLKEELDDREEKLVISYELGAVNTISVIEEAETKKAIRFILAAPNGVQEMSASINGLVETSLNLGVAKLQDNTLSTHIAVRSSVDSAKEALIDKVSSVYDLAGAEVEISGNYPGWAYRVDSPLREKMVPLYRDLFKREPKIEAIHAGLECGLFAGKLKGLDCVSFGPNIQDIHTTEERLDIKSTERIYQYVLSILETK